MKHFEMFLIFLGSSLIALGIIAVANALALVSM